MSYKRVLARWLHKRLSHNYVQASMREHYTISLLTIIRDSGVKRYPEIRNNIIQVIEALDEMKEKKVIANYEVIKLKNGRKIIDAKFQLIPHPSFVSETILSNKRKGKMPMREVKRIVERHGPEFAQRNIKDD